MSLELFYEVPAGAIETLVDAENKPLFKRADLGRYLDIKNIKSNFVEVVKTRTRKEIMRGRSDLPLKKDQNWHDCFVFLDGALEIAVKSRKPRAVELIKCLTRKGVEKLAEEHRQTIADRDTRIRAIEYDNVALQAQRDVYREQVADLIANRFVPRSGNFDTVLVAIEKNTETEADEKARPFTNYMLRCQKKQVNERLSVLRVKYPDMLVLEPECDDPNAVHAWNRFKRGVLTRANYYRNHFNLPEEARELFEDVFSIRV